MPAIGRRRYRPVPGRVAAELTEPPLFTTVSAAITPARRWRVDAEETDEVNGIGGVLRLVQTRSRHSCLGVRPTWSKAARSISAWVSASCRCSAGWWVSSMTNTEQVRQA